jgi:pilus assembly protein Flp/PilA
MKTSLWKIVAFINDEAGASSVEYVLLVALIALAITAGATTLGTKLSGFFTTAAAQMPT